ncbi:MAG: hypothetical protein K5880_14655 [Hydrogenophaga sp.]|uniref:hypothetical protein n=1 Tax=Hydrogenophaga sp. TaxID=1904254 RepID=UPI0026321F46|nr:hypothetical protein [Hydrogenophaga sp.]MCV0439851.1 hypothetical protein [Hydrogenophaga sp.]
MNRYLIYDPERDSYVKMTNGGWMSGFEAEAVNSYGSLEEAREDIRPFDSLKQCQIVEVIKTIEIVKHWELV